MIVTIEFYGRLRSLFGEDRMTWSTEQPTLKKLYQNLCQWRQVNDDTSGIKPVVNDIFAQWKDTYSDGDVIGFLPPASGG